MSKAEGWEGKNVLVWVMDEASAFRTANGVDNPKSVYDSLRSSSMSRFGWMHWMGFIISFPRKQQGDFTLDEFERSKDNPNIYGRRGATWQINPRFQKGHPMYRPESDVWVLIEDLNIQVPKEFEEDFLADGVDAMTRYMAEPPLTEGGFFENPHTITESVNKRLQPLVAKVGEREQVLETEEGVTVVRKYVTRIIETLPPRVDGAPYFMHGDPGLKKDSFTIAVAHTLPEVKVVKGWRGTAEVSLQRVVVDFVLSWDPRPNRPVDLLDVDATILELCKHYGIKKVTFDRWNSAQEVTFDAVVGVTASPCRESAPHAFPQARGGVQVRTRGIRPPWCWRSGQI